MKLQVDSIGTRIMDLMRLCFSYIFFFNAANAALEVFHRTKRVDDPSRFA